MSPVLHEELEKMTLPSFIKQQLFLSDQQAIQVVATRG
jgi:hypothetical protein